ncbi:MAG: carbohydrate ABC transporter permease [Stackebrandtia sp.]
MKSKPAVGHDEARLLARKVAARIGFYVATCLIAVFFALPLLWLITAPFDASPGYAVGFPDVTFDNFAKVFDNRYALGSLLNSIVLAAGTTAFVVIGAALASYALARVRIPGRDALLYVLLLLSSVVTGTAAMVPLYLLVNEIGDRVSPVLGSDSHFAVMLVMAGGLLPAAIFMLKDFIDTIPKSYEESARVFGASPLRTLKDVVVPLIAPGLATITVWSVVNVWGNFLIPFILLRDDEKQPAAVVAQTMYDTAGQPNLALLGAFSLLYSLPVVALYLFVARRYGFRFHGGIKS